MKRMFKKKGKRLFAMLLAAIMTVLSMQGISFPRTAKAAGEFPVSGVHSGTLSHGAYKKLTNLKASTGASVIEADTMTSEGESRACFCLSPGQSQTTKSGAYKSATYASGYGIRYYKALIAFYYDCKDSYKTDAVRYAANIFIWRTVMLERNHKGNFAASAYNAGGFKSGFVATMKNLMGYSQTTAENLYNKAYDYVKKGANGIYNNKVKLLKWTATSSQTMLTGKPYSDKSCRIKFTKGLSEDNGVSVKGTEYVIYTDKNCTKKYKTITIKADKTDTISFSVGGTYTGTDTYYVKETKAVTGTVSNKNKTAMSFSIDWSKIADGGNGGTAVIGAKKVTTSKSWLKNTKNIEEQFVDDVPGITVNVKKVITGTTTGVGGAEFTIYTWNKNQNRYVKVTKDNNLGHAVTNPIVTGSNGTASSAKLYYTGKNLGRFYIKETKAPKGYQIDSSEKKFTIKSGSSVTNAAQTFTYAHENDKIPSLTWIYVKKTDGDTGEPLTMAGFTLYEASVLTRNGISTYMGHKYDHAYKEFTQRKDKDGPTNTYEALNIPEGYYTIEETTVPLGYSIGSGTGFYNSSPFGRPLSAVRGKDSPYRYIQLVYADSTGVYPCDMDPQTHVFTKKTTPVDAFTVEITNTQAAGSLVVHKKDDKTGEPLAGAKFTVWEVTEEKYNTAGYIPDSANGDVLYATGITDERGRCEFGTDYARYQLGSDGKPLTDENGDPVKREDEDPSCCIYGLKAEHYYMIVEEAAPDGYRLPDYPVHKLYVSADEALNTASIDDLSFEKEINVTNEKALLDLNLHKISESRTGKESVALPGAKFALFRVEKIVTDDSALSEDQEQLEDENNNGIDDITEEAVSEDTEITSQSDTGADENIGTDIDYSVLSNENYIDFDYSTITPLVKDIMTDENGNAVIPEILEEGGYVLVETEAPKNYLKADPQYIYIDNATLMSTTEFNIEVRDQEFESRIAIEKQDAATGETIKRAGTGYKIKNKATGQYVVQTLDTYAEPEVEGAPHDLISSEKVDTFYTDETGTVQLPEVLAVGTYELEEVSAPDGYLLADETLEFVIDDDMDYYPEDDNKQYDIDENTRDIVITVEQKDEPTKVQFSKTDITGEKEIPDCKIEVTHKATGELVEAFTTTDKPHMIEGKLKPGETYVFTETRPKDGYVTADSIEFTVKDTGEIQKVTMKDDTTKVQFSKTDITGEKSVPDCFMEVRKKSDNTLVENWITTDKEYLIEGKLAAGETYLLIEKCPKDGYATAESIEFTVKDTGEIQKVVMKDDTTKIYFYKYASNTKKLLPGTKWKIIDENGTEVYRFTTGKKVTVIEGILAVGHTYTFVELSAPENYEKVKDFDYTVKDTGEIQKIKVTDKYHTPDTPQTENPPSTPKTGAGAISLWMMILLVVLGSGIFIVSRKRKKRK